jgi:general secretion pathway protein E
MKIARGDEPAPADAPEAAPLVRIPYAFARRHGLVPAAEADGRLDVAMREGADPKALIELRRYLARPFGIYEVDGPAFDRLLSDLYPSGTEAAADAAGSLGFGDDLGHLAAGLPSAEDLLDTSDDAPAIRLINGIIADAARQGVSDIHIEPYETGLVVRMRMDGVLRETLRMPPHVAPVVVSRVKVMARLDIAERRLPQDGRIGLTLGGKLIDVRVSTLPSRAGERVVLRILDKENAGIDLEMLGMNDTADRLLRGALAEPNGIVLVTGPTGSGKTTTLYAGLKLLNDGSRNILTVEDPVEYAVDGVGQTQINPQVGLTFAAGLRAILRQDPDVVMVGEVRDRETADIAVQAALTGHLVLSTVHTNDAVGAITRLRDMKVEPFLIASTVRAVIAQRLVRRLCAQCRQPVEASGSLSSLLGLESGTIVYEPGGCAACGNSGYKGRIGVFEAVRVDDEVRRLINAGAEETAIAAHVFRSSDTLTEAARRLVREGATSPEEAVRVSRREADHA